MGINLFAYELASLKLVIKMPTKVTLYFSRISSDLETGTSSDIEIISMASTYGDGNGEARMMDFVPVPLTRAVFKTKMRDVSPDELSPSSSQPSPSSDSEVSSMMANNTGGANDEEKILQAESGNNPLETQTLLRVSGGFRYCFSN